MRSKILVGGILLTTIITWQCSSPSSHEITWTQGRATAISISATIYGTLSEDSIADHFAIRLSNSSNEQNILGDWALMNNQLTFKPIISFSRGYTYEILRKSKRILLFTIPPDNNASIPQVMHIYPSADSVPENLLKVYLQFSEPMAAGKSLQYVTLIRNNLDTLPDTFLDLQPELWNPDGSCLTLWLDPGRIKQGLIPNEQLGALLKSGDTYTLIISSGWLSKQGKKSVNNMVKTFYVGPRDDQKPDITKWQISHPRKGTKDTLHIDFSKALDFMLIKSAITFEDSSGHEVPGEISINKNERGLFFLPITNWTSGVYFINADPQLEDLAGNNLSRPFDRNLLKDAPPDQRSKFLRRVDIE